MTLFAWRRWWAADGLPALRLLALERWDPLNVYGDPERVDEYDAYLERVGRMLRKGAGVEEILGYLRDVRAKALRREGGEFVDEAFANEVVAWYALEAPRG